MTEPDDPHSTWERVVTQSDVDAPTRGRSWGVETVYDGVVVMIAVAGVVGHVVLFVRLFHGALFGG